MENRMRKVNVSYTLPDCKAVYINKLAEQTGKSRSQVLEALIDTLQLYFTNEQLDMEILGHESTDYRAK
jgi:hypothetical protein